MEPAAKLAGRRAPAVQLGEEPHAAETHRIIDDIPQVCRIFANNFNGDHRPCRGQGPKPGAVVWREAMKDDRDGLFHIMSRRSA